MSLKTPVSEHNRFYLAPTPFQMSYYYEDTSHYCYTIPAHYEDTSSYRYSTPADYDSPSDPVYYDDTPSNPTHYVGNIPNWSSSVSPTSYEVKYKQELNNDGEVIYYEEDIHPAYHDSPADIYEEPMQIPTWDKLHPVYRNPPADINHEPIHSLTSNILEPSRPPSDDICGYIDSFTDEELAQETQEVEEMLEEMRVWDIEDEQNRTLGRKVPGVNPPDQPYRESDDFKRLTHRMEYLEAIHRGRTKRDVGGTEDEPEVSDIMARLPVQPQTSSPHYNFNDETITTPPPDILIPNPLPLSPNIQCEPTLSAILVDAAKHREPRYYFGSPPRRRQTRHQPRAHRSLPPDIGLPKSIPPKPNIPIQSPTFQQPQHPPGMQPQRKHPPHPRSQIHPLIPHHHRNVIRHIPKRVPTLFPDVRGQTSLGGR